MTERGDHTDYGQAELSEASFRVSREQDRPYRLKIEQAANGSYIGTLVGPGIDFAEIVTGDTANECEREARKRVEWIRTRPPAEEIEL